LRRQDLKSTSWHRLHISDLGGEDNVSEAERALVRCAVTLIVELERREVMFAQAGAA
jgi:hypothetical protein